MTKIERDNLILANQYIPIDVYKRLSGLPSVRRLGLDDSWGVGIIALIRTVDWYNPDHPKCHDFRLAAWMNIKRAILDAARKFLPIPLPPGSSDWAPVGFTSKEKVLKQITDGRLSHETEVDEREEKTALLNSVRAAAEFLPSVQKEILYARYFQGKSIRQLGTELGISRQTVLNEERRAIEAIQDRLGIPLRRHFHPEIRFPRRNRTLANL